MESAARTFYLVTSNSSMIGYNDANNYLKTLFARCTQGYIEIRPIPDSGGLRQWIPLSNIVAPTVSTNSDIYVGVATRREGGGKKEDIIEIPAVWVDIDFKDSEQKEVEKRIEEFASEPSIVVESGHGFHLYWILKTPAQFGDIQKIEDVNRRLASHFGGDEASSEAARILRLPGTYNQKYSPARLVSISSINDNTYHIDDFSFLPQPDPPKPASSGEKQDWYTSLLEGVKQGNRANAVMRLSGRYIEKGLSKNEAEILLSQWNKQNIPPLEDDELEKTIVSAYKQYGGESISLMPSGSNLQDCKAIIESSVMSFHSLMGKHIEPKPLIIDPLLKKGESIMISAIRGVGKTWLALSLGFIATRQGSIGKWKTGTPVGCLYVDGEVSEEEMKDRITALEMGRMREVAPFNLLSLDEMRSDDKKIPNLSDPNWRDGLSEYLKEHPEYELLIIDNLASLTPGRDENKKRDWDDINQWFLKLNAKGISVIFVHHAGKSGEQRGTSAIEDNINFSIKLKRPVGYDAGGGAKFIVEFGKTRRLYGVDAKSFILDLQPGNNGLRWEVVQDDETLRRERIIEMLSDGELNQKQIADKEDVHSSYVNQVKKKAIEQGELIDSDIKIGKRGRKPKQSQEELASKDKKGQESLLAGVLKEFGRINKVLLEEPCSQEKEFVEVPCAHEEVKEIY